MSRPVGIPDDKGSQVGRESRYYMRSDEELRNEVEAALRGAAHFHGSDLRVTVDNGHVVLSGRARDRMAAQAAQNAAAAVLGVRDVRLDLSEDGEEVGGASARKPTNLENLMEGAANDE